MEKNQLKWYDAPTVEVVDVEVQGILCASTNAGDVDMEDPLPSV